MKKGLFIFFFFGALCSLGFNGCQKTMKDASQEVFKQGPGSESNFFDPASLISASQQGKLDTIQKGFKFTEGPAVDRQGNVYFTDQPDDRIYRWDAATGKITQFLQGTGRSNGMAVDRNGDLIACADMHGELWKIHMDGGHEVLVNDYNGK